MRTTAALIGRSIPWILGACCLCAGPRAQCATAQFTAVDAASTQEFGWAVDVRGGRALVGAFGRGTDGIHGSAYVFARVASGWQQEAKLLPPAAVTVAGFGQAVALDDGFALVGARYADLAGNDAGAAFVYRAAPGGWVLDATLLPVSGGAGDEFGQSVAIGGGIAVVGAAGDDGAGAAYVFRNVAGAWVFEAKLRGGAAAANDAFGAAVDLGGGRIVVGAPGDDTAGPNAGCIYVFEHDTPGWLETAKIVAPDAAAARGFGFAIGVSGDALVAGTPGAGVGGEARVLRLVGGLWSVEASLVAADATARQSFGFAVAIDGDRAAIGAFADDGFKGAAYVFERSGALWTQRAKLRDDDPQSAEYFGFSIALSADDLLVGCPDDHALGFASGSASWHSLAKAKATAYGAGWPGRLGVPSLTASAAPVLGSSIAIEIGNASGAPSSGAFLLGSAPATLATAFGGTLLVVPDVAIPFALPAAGRALPVTIPSEPMLCGQRAYCQALEIDAGASQGVSFTPGLQLTLGS